MLDEVKIPLYQEYVKIFLKGVVWKEPCNV